MNEFITQHYICFAVSLWLLTCIITSLIQGFLDKKTAQIKYLEWLIENEYMDKEDIIAYYNRYKSNNKI